MATATKRDSTYTTLATHVLDQWFNPQKAEDIVFKEIPLYWILSQIAKTTRKIPADITLRLMADKAGGAQAFGGYDTVDTSPSKGAQAARFSPAQYSIPLTMSQVLGRGVM